MKPTNLFFSNYQKVLRFLASHPDRDFMESEIRASIDISKAGANNALRALVADRLVEIEKKGRLSLYHASLKNPLIRQVKVLINLLEIDQFVAAIKEISDRIVLFGSAASGTDDENSDIDLFVLSDSPDRVRNAAQKHHGERQVHLVIRKPLEYIASRKKDSVFFEEVSRGIVVHGEQS